jgi:ectoine hydroxylase-related dioxygenase (phytanoyl-CoA dioxygenase family)
MNREPLKPVTQEHIDAYRRDGVVCLRGMFDRDWIELLRPAAERVIAMDEREKNKLRVFGNKHLWHGFPEFRRYCFESPAAEIVGRVLQSSDIRFFFDQVWAKAPGSTFKTPWHTDRMGWPVDGEMVPSFWMAISPVVKANSLECIAGSHKDATRYWNKTQNSKQMIQPPDRPNFPDYDLRRDDASLTFFKWDMEPGDAILIHPWCFHCSCGNPTPNWRIAVSTRWFGDDICWNPRPESINHPGYSFDEMVKGERPDGPLFPVVWRDPAAALRHAAE